MVESEEGKTGQALGLSCVSTLLCLVRPCEGHRSSPVEQIKPHAISDSRIIEGEDDRDPVKNIWLARLTLAVCASMDLAFSTSRI